MKNCDYDTINIVASEANLTETDNVEPHEDSPFIGTGDDPYDLIAGSPCIGAGINEGNLDHDIDYPGRTPRDRPLPADGTVDIGAYEYQQLAPVAEFIGDPLTITAGEFVQFTDQSTNNPTEWEWKVDEGVVSAEQNPEINFLGTGTFTITLKATNWGGFDEEVKEDYITVEAVPSGTNFLARRKYGRNSRMFTLARRYER
jgi:PKD repeat protein